MRRRFIEAHAALLRQEDRLAFERLQGRSSARRVHRIAVLRRRLAAIRRETKQAADRRVHRARRIRVPR